MQKDLKKGKLLNHTIVCSSLNTKNTFSLAIINWKSSYPHRFTEALAFKQSNIIDSRI